MTQSPSYKAFWTEKAKKSASKIVEYLQHEWTEKEVNNFLNEVDRTDSAIEIYPRLFKQSIKRKDIHLALVTKHSFLVYRVKPEKNKYNFFYFGLPGKTRKNLLTSQ